MARTSPTRAGVALRIRTAAGLVAIVASITVIACSAPPKGSTTDAAASASSSTTAVDPGTGPTSITRSLRTVEVAGGFDTPTSMVNRPMRNQLWIAERPGRIMVIQLEADWNLETGQTVRGGAKTYPFPALDISGDVSLDGGRGLLGIAFSTDARTLFLDYVNRKGEIVVAAWTVTDPVPPPTTTTTTPAAPSSSSSSSTSTTRAEATTTTTAPHAPIPPPSIDERSRRVLLTIPHDGTSNYGGQLALGRDGYLYIGVGDSTKGSAERNAQNTDSYLGKLLRIDPGGATIAETYVIPSSNPYAKGGGAAPVFTLGIQNPLRFSFDRSNGDLWLGDAGAGRTQEIEMLTAASGGGRGANLGWPDTEGTKAPATDAAKFTTPILAFEATGDDCPVIGGYVYRGSAIPDLQGVYLYGDRCSGTISGLLQRRGRVLDTKAMGPQVATNTLASFGQDDQGELYVVLSNGSVQRLVAR